MFNKKILFAMIGAMLVSAPFKVYALNNIEIYLAGYGMATDPLNQGLFLKGKGVSDEKIDGDPGLGIKVGLFPSFFNGYLGMELETFGHNNSLNFPVVVGGAAKTKGKSSLVTYHSMINLLLRYPGRHARPYLGIGGGLSNGMLFNTDIPGRKDKNVEIGSAPGYQLFGGIQVLITERWFVFGEYKYSAANYHWSQLSLNFRSEYFVGGLGYVF